MNATCKNCSMSEAAAVRAEKREEELMLTLVYVDEMLTRALSDQQVDTSDEAPIRLAHSRVKAELPQ